MAVNTMLATILAGLMVSAVAKSGAKCASNFCEDPSNCPKCDPGEKCVTTPGMMCAGTCFGKCQAGASPAPAGASPAPAVKKVADIIASLPGKLGLNHPSIDKALQAFNKCDTDKDGSLSKDEFSKCTDLKYLAFDACRKKDTSKITRIELERCAAHHAFVSCDKNKDGSLSEAEFSQCAELKKFGFRMCDKNHDGKVSEAELDKCVYEMDYGNAAGSPGAAKLGLGNRVGHAVKEAEKAAEDAGKVAVGTVKGAVKGAKQGAKEAKQATKDKVKVIVQ